MTRWLWPFIIAAIAFCSSPVLADRAADEATAKKNFESGLKLFGEGAYAEALVAFEASYRLGGRPSALKNVAQCHRNLKHFVEAYETYEQLIAAHGDKLPPPDKKAVDQALDELSVLTGAVAIAVSEAGADVEIDGKSIGTSPLPKPKRVSVGTHRVKVSKASFEKVEQDVNVGSQETKKLDVKLEPEKLVGHVIVREPNGRDVKVFLDGEEKGPAPWEGDVAAGEHKIEVKGARFASESRKITITAKERVDIVLDAQPVTGHLRVTTIPASASIAIDGRTVGSGAWEGDLPEGPHKIEATAEGQPPQQREVFVGRGQMVVQEIPIVAALGLARPVDYRGIYVQLALFGGIGVAGKVSNEQPSVLSRQGSAMLEAGATLRGGYSLGILSAELVGSFMFEHRDETLRTPQSGAGQQTYNDEANGPNFFIGVGPRVTSKDDTIRFTFGIAPGIAIRNFDFHRDTNGGNNGGGNPNAPFAPQNNATGSGNGQDFSAGYTTFGFMADGGMLLGSTPGAKFYLGVNAWLDFGREIVIGPETRSSLPDSAFTKPGRGILVSDGVQFIIGPTLGLRFGH
jgi:hypothetical protein